MKNKVITALLSLVIAFGLWAYVVTVISPESEETYYDVPVVLDGQALLAQRDLMIVSQDALKVDLTLSGYRTDLNKLNSSNITLLADLSQITEPGTHKLSYTPAYPGTVQAGNLHAVNKDPQFITLTVVERSTKEIPVKVTYKGNLPSGYTADRQNVGLDHSTVTVSGPKSVIETIAMAKIEIDLSQRYETFTHAERHTLCDEKGNPVEDVGDVTANVGTIKAEVKILKLENIPLKLLVIPGGGITADMITIDMEWESILASADMKSLEKLQELKKNGQILGTIDLGRLTEDTSFEFHVTLPSGINNVSGITTVRVDVKMPKMETREFVIGSDRFVITNVPEGMEFHLQTVLLTVKFRGPVMLLDELAQNLDRIIVYVDLSEGQAGSASYVATVQLQDMEAVGAVGAYEVSIELTDITTAQPDGPEA